MSSGEIPDNPELRRNENGVFGEESGSGSMNGQNVIAEDCAPSGSTVDEESETDKKVLSEDYRQNDPKDESVTTDGRRKSKELPVVITHRDD